MNIEWNSILSTVAEEVFGSLAFLMVMPDDGDEGSVDTEGVAARITFDGPFEGALFVRVSDEALLEIATNMLGMMDEEPPRSQQLDAFRELLNVICGNLLPEIAGTEAVFNVHAGEMLPDGEIPATYCERPIVAEADLNIDVGTARLVFFVNQPVGADSSVSS